MKQLKYSKKLIQLTTVLFVFCIIACTKKPTADFSADKTKVETGEFISLTNFSEFSDSYKWDFGDGTSSGQESPMKSYQNSGTYTINLEAVSKNEKKSHTISKLVTVIPSVEKYIGNYLGSGNVVLTSNGLSYLTPIDTIAIFKVQNSEKNINIKEHLIGEFKASVFYNSISFEPYTENNFKMISGNGQFINGTINIYFYGNYINANTGEIAGSLSFNYTGSKL